MTPFPARSLLFGLCCGLLLTACDDDRIHNICANYPALCEDLVDDGWCRYERSDIIRARYYLQAEGTERRQYELMRSLERYLKCAERSTNIEYKRAREQKSPRVEGMLAAGDQLARLDAATRNSQDPYLLLWHWTNNSDERARQQFLAQEGRKGLEEPDLQLVLAGIYAKSEPDKAIAILHHGLSLYREGEQVNSRLLTSLSTLYMGQKQYEQAYLWGKVSEAFPNNPEVSAKRFGLYYSLSKPRQDALDAQAAEIVRQLQGGSYRP